VIKRVDKMNVKFDLAEATDISTPLNGTSFSSDSLLMQEMSMVGKLTLRGDFDSAAVASAVQDTLSLPVDIEANTFAREADRTVFWTGPDERLIYTELGSVDNHLASLREKLPGKSSVVDVSDYYTVIRLSGEKVRAVLASGTPLDVHRSVFGKGQCAQTRYGTASVLLAVHDDIPVVDLQVRWSFAEYVWKYLCKVANYC
jgi:sarcosine oxidase subunit gamma